MRFIQPIDNYSFDGEKFVLYTKSNPVRSFIIGALLALCLISIKPLNNYSYDAPSVDNVSAVFKQDLVKNSFVEYIKQVNPRVKDDDATNIASSIIKWGSEFKVSPTLLLAIAKVESTFDKHAISHAGAQGIFQVLPRWHIDKIKKAKEDLGTPEMFKIEPNVYVGTLVIKDCTKKFGSIENALKCYNGSVGMETTYAVDVLRAKSAIENKIKGIEI